LDLPALCSLTLSPRELSKAASSKHWARRCFLFPLALLTQHKERQLADRESETGTGSELKPSTMVSDPLSALGLDLETLRELEELKACVISRYRQLRYEELRLALASTDRRDKETRLMINNELKALQFTAPTSSLSLSVEEIQSRVEAVLARLEVRESDLLLEQNDAISSSLCELSRRAFLQTLHHFECGLALPDDGRKVLFPSPSRSLILECLSEWNGPCCLAVDMLRAFDPNRSEAKQTRHLGCLLCWGR
jgi:hypothetical protein